jgi:hypothetical protein
MVDHRSMVTDLEKIRLTWGIYMNGDGVLSLGMNKLGQMVIVSLRRGCSTRKEHRHMVMVVYSDSWSYTNDETMVEIERYQSQCLSPRVSEYCVRMEVKQGMDS